MPDFGRWTSNGGDPSLNDINRTDRFLDALASEQPVHATDAGEAELAELLTGWRDEVRQPPVRRPVTMADAATALDQAPTPRRRPRMPLAIVGSVAAAMLCLGGFGAVVYGAGPGDALYGLRTMMFGAQHVNRDDAVVLAAQTELAEVQQLIDDGQWVEAQDRLQAVTTTVATVDDVERKQELVDQWQQLSVKVEARDVNATVPPDAPPVTLPEVPADSPLPAIVEPGTTTTTTTLSEPSESSESSETTTPSTETTTPTSAAPTSESTVPSSETAAPPAEPPAPTSEPTTPTSETASATPTPRATSTVPPSPTSTSQPVEAPPPPSTTTTLTIAPPVTTTPAAASGEPASGGDEITVQEAPKWETSATAGGGGGGQVDLDQRAPTLTFPVPTLPTVEPPVPEAGGGASGAEE